MPTELSKSELIELVFGGLRDLTIQNPIGIIQEANVIRSTAKYAIEAGAIEVSDSPSAAVNYDYELGPDTRLLVKEIIWDFIVSGILTVGADASNREYPWIRPTGYGLHCIRAGEYLPYDPDGFVAHLSSKVAGISSNLALDDIAKAYIHDALRAFRAGAYLGTVFLVGAAAERLLLVLRGSLENSLADEKERCRFQEKTEAMHARSLFEAILEKLKQKRSQMPRNLWIDTDAKLHQLARNEVGHPTGASFVREAAVAYLYSFAHYTAEMYKLVSFLNSGPLK